MYSALLATLLLFPTLDVDTQALKDASVRIITIKEAKENCPNCGKKHNLMGCGSGTIVASAEDGEAFNNYVITARHVADEDEKITVEIFENDKSLGGYEGQLLIKSGSGKNDADVALVKFRSLRKFKTAAIASENYQLNNGDPVICIGFPDGQIPSKILNGAMRVSLLEIHAGVSFVECDKLPKEGQSGGGLFNKNGELVGVCNARHDCDNCRKKVGIYSSWQEVIKLLKGSKYEFLINKNP